MYSKRQKVSVERCTECFGCAVLLCFVVCTCMNVLASSFLNSHIHVHIQCHVHVCDCIYNVVYMYMNAAYIYIYRYTCHTADVCVDESL